MVEIKDVFNKIGKGRQAYYLQYFSANKSRNENMRAWLLKFDATTFFYASIISHYENSSTNSNVLELGILITTVGLRTKVIELLN